MFDLAMVTPGLVVRVQVLTAIEDYSPIAAGELGTIIYANERHIIIRWDRLHRSLRAYDNTTVIATDDLDTMARLTAFAAGYPRKGPQEALPVRAAIG